MSCVRRAPRDALVYGRRACDDRMCGKSCRRDRETTVAYGICTRTVPESGAWSGDTVHAYMYAYRMRAGTGGRRSGSLSAKFKFIESTYTCLKPLPAIMGAPPSAVRRVLPGTLGTQNATRATPTARARDRPMAHRHAGALLVRCESAGAVLRRRCPRRSALAAPSPP